MIRERNVDRAYFCAVGYAICTGTHVGFWQAALAFVVGWLVTAIAYEGVDRIWHDKRVTT